MGGSSRRKGVSGEREVAAIWEDAGAGVRGLECLGDHLVILGGVTDGIIHSEVKRYGSRCKWPEWWAQTSRDAPPGTVPALHTRADKGEWLVTLRLSDFVRLVGS
jgi:hypothetical protein